jgi:hypothetical protein
MENARNSVPSHFEEDKKSSEFRSEPFGRREKQSELINFIPNYSAEDKNARNSFRTLFYAVKHKIGEFEGFFEGAKNFLTSNCPERSEGQF